MDSSGAMAPATKIERRRLLASIAVLPVAAAWTGRALPARRVRPGMAGWPTAAAWSALSQQVGGRLSPVTVPHLAPAAASRLLANPFYLGSEPGLTQSSGWAGAWQSCPSAYMVVAAHAADVAHAVRFAQAHNLRLVVKGGGHSYLGGSNAPDSLLIFTRAMDAIVVHDAFVPAGTDAAPVPAVSVGAGCLWGRVYDAVTTRAGRYVQGGGCTTVGVAGLVQGGGFGSFSKAFGLACASLIEAEIVTADGAIRTVNAAQDPDLLWALKGGGGGSFGVVTRLTLQTYDLPAQFGALRWTITAQSDAAFARLLDRFVDHLATRLCNPHWGEQVRATPDNQLVIEMVFQGIDSNTARAAWSGLAAFVAAAPRQYTVTQPLLALAAPAQHFWDEAFLHHYAPGAITRDDRPDAGARDFWWAGDGAQAGAQWHGYSSAWLPAGLLRPESRALLVDAWFSASRHWPVAFHFNKGLAGAPEAALAAARDTAMNPQVLDAFALAIIACDGPSSFPGLVPAPAAEARRHAAAIEMAMRHLRHAAPDAGNYLSECDYFRADWQRASWGEHWARLDRVKRRYDPQDLFVVHHGVGSERWSRDGFSRA